MINLNKFIKSSLQIRDTKYYLYQYNDEQIRVVKLNSVKQKRLGRGKQNTKKR